MIKPESATVIYDLQVTAAGDVDFSLNSTILICEFYSSQEFK